MTPYDFVRGICVHIMIERPCFTRHAVSEVLLFKLVHTSNISGRKHKGEITFQKCLFSLFFQTFTLALLSNFLILPH